MVVRGRTLSPPSLLEIAATVLVSDPGASLADVAVAAGIGRTTLHKRFPTRHHLLLAIASDALDDLEAIYARIGARQGEDAPEVLDRLIAELVPIGPRLAFLLRERSLEAEEDLVRRVDALDDVLRGLVRAAQRAGTVRADVPDVWIVASLNGLLYAAWELIELGRLAPLDGPRLVSDSLFHGIDPTPTAAGG